MKPVFKFVSVACSVLVIGTIHASECSNGGTKVKFKGKINNNAIHLNDENDSEGNYTSGIAILKLRGDGEKEKMTCALFGEPLSIADYSPEGLPYQYHHMLVCDDSAQSELHFKTGFVNVFQHADDEPPFIQEEDYATGFFGPSPVLSKKQIKNYCSDTAVIWFVEQADVDADKDDDGKDIKTRKGIFAGATGSLDIGGCVNLAGQYFQYAEINMDVSGNLCLPEW